MSNWLVDKLIPSIMRSEVKKSSVPEGLWHKCPSCEAVLYRPELEKTLDVCPKCNHHMRIGARARIDIFLDAEGRNELGADLEDDDAVEARKAFDAASKRLAAVGEQLGDRSVLPVSATADLFYAGDPKQFPDIAYYQSIGLPIAPVKAKKGSYWDELSWEKSDTYNADIVLWDDRLGAAGLKTLKAQPVFGTITGARNDAYVPWAAVTPPGYEAYAHVLDTLADDIEEQL